METSATSSASDDGAHLQARRKEGAMRIGLQNPASDTKTGKLGVCCLYVLRKTGGVGK